MLWAYVISAIFGIVIGLFFKTAFLIAASFLLLIGGLIAGLLLQFSVTPAVFISFTLIVTLQLGYLGGLALLFLFRRVRERLAQKIGLDLYSAEKREQLRMML